MSPAPATASTSKCRPRRCAAGTRWMRSGSVSRSRRGWRCCSWTSPSASGWSASLAESEARFSALADGLPMPVWVLDAQGVVRFVNSAYGEFFGIDISSGTVSAWSELLHPDDLSIFQFELAAALDEQRGLHALVRARRHDGQWRWIEMTATPRYSADGRFIGLAGSSPDVTEQREIELAREQLLESERSARNEAESMARLKDEFLATLSHEPAHAADHHPGVERAVAAAGRRRPSQLQGPVGDRQQRPCAETPDLGHARSQQHVAGQGAAGGRVAGPGRAGARSLEHPGAWRPRARTRY